MQAPAQARSAAAYGARSRTRTHGGYMPTARSPPLPASAGVAGVGARASPELARSPALGARNSPQRPAMELSGAPAFAPPRAQMVMSPAEREASQSRATSPLGATSERSQHIYMGGVRRISSTPDVALGAASASGALRSATPSMRGPASPTEPRRMYAATSAGGAPRSGTPTEDLRPLDDTQSSLSVQRRAGGLSPLASREPSAVASTTALGTTTANMMRRAPLGASTNQVLGAGQAPTPPLGAEDASRVGGAGRATPSEMTAPVGNGRALPSTASFTHGLFRGEPSEALQGRSTMLALSLVRSTGSPGGKHALMRRMSMQSESGRRRRASGETGGAPGEDATQLHMHLAIMSHNMPPRKVGSTQVLVQVIAVAVDDIDRAIVRDKARSEHAYGFVPGRSFCGRVVECGWHVKKLRKGDIVFGLLDARKCGALAELIAVDQDVVVQVPDTPLSVEQVAALPSTGVMVHQIVQNHCTLLPTGARVLILNAHDGVGLLTMQEARRLRLVIVAQVPPQVTDGISICEANGANEVVTGEPLWAINLLHESSFDLVIDTVGGRRIYDAGRRVLANNGHFVTCCGDTQTLANPTYRSHLRSLRRAFIKKDRKNIGYEWIGIDASIDTRSALDAVMRAAQRGAICPRLQSVLPLEGAPRSFDMASDDSSAGVAVVRLS